MVGITLGLGEKTVEQAGGWERFAESVARRLQTEAMEVRPRSRREFVIGAEPHFGIVLQHSGTEEVGS